jgi:sortase B
MGKGWRIAQRLAQIGDRLVDCIISFILVVALLFSGFALWDNWNILNNAKLDSLVSKYRPEDTGDDSSENPTLSELQAINPDVCAWLTVDNTSIDYPVVIGEDNTSYLNWDVQGEFSLSGSIFLDFRNSRDFTDFYSLIYGHHMEGNVMFGQLPEFLDTEFFKTHAGGSLFLPDRTLRIQWYACLETDAYDSQIFNPTYVGQDDQTKQAFLNYIQEKATQYRDVGVTTSDQIVALSTCQDAITDGRVILVGRVVQ